MCLQFIQRKHIDHKLSSGLLKRRHDSISCYAQKYLIIGSRIDLVADNDKKIGFAAFVKLIITVGKDQFIRTASCESIGNGLTNKDALAIQKLMLDIISSLPETL